MSPSGVIDEDIEPTVALHSRRDHGLDLRLIGDVSPMRYCIGPQRLNLFRGRFGVIGRMRIVDENGLDARFRETQRRRAPDARAATSDNRDSASQFHPGLDPNAPTRDPIPALFM